MRRILSGDGTNSSTSETTSSSRYKARIDEISTKTAFAEVVQRVESVARYTTPNETVFLDGADP